MFIKKSILYLVCLVFLFPPGVHAYLDPGTGSYVFQLLVAGILGSLFFIRSIFKRLVDFIVSKFLKRSRHNGEKS